jgi:pantoate kinase
MVPVANIDYEASLLAVIVGMVAAIVAASVVIGSRSARRGEDLQQGREVDTLIARRGDQLAGYVLVFGIVLGMGLAMSGAAALWIANGLFAAAVAAGITRSAFVVYTYLIHRHARQKLPPQSY